MCRIRKTDPDWGTEMFDSRDCPRNYRKCLLLREMWNLPDEQGDEWGHQTSHSLVFLVCYKAIK